MLTKAAPLDNLDSCCIGNDGSDLLRHLYPTDYAGISFANSDQHSMLGDLGAACGRRKLGTPPWREAQPIELPSSLRGQKQEEHRCGRALHATKPTPLERAQSTWASTVARSILPDATGAGRGPRCKQAMQPDA